jgi:LysR family transcriptional regulator, glycine cleavage system transcriptional activator
MANQDARFPSIDALRAFEAAARLSSFDRAANELSVTASALSKRISSLENLIGTPLFDRTGRAVALTASGKEYAEQVRGALNQLSAIALHTRSAQAVDRLRVLAPPTFAREILVPSLKTFTAKHPQLEIEIVVAIPYLNRDAPEADVTIHFGPRSAGEPLLFEPVFAVAMPGFAKEYALTSPADLACTKSPVPRVRCPLEPWAPWFAGLGFAGAEPEGGLKVVDLGLMLESAAQGHGAALARATIAARWLQSGALVALFPGAQIAPSDGYSLTVQRAHPSALAFARWLHAVCKKLEKSSSKT